MSNITLGLDIGSNSIGWALVDTDGEQIIDCGVRVFPEGVDRDAKGAEISKNENRRLARSARRNRWRKAMRKDILVRLLQRNDLLPKDVNAILELMNLDPYMLRARGLKEQLSNYEIGRALFHLNQRRGFWSNRKTAKKEDGVVTKEATALAEKIEESGCITLGEYLASLDRDENRIRGIYTFRSMYENEFELFWKRQLEFNSELSQELGDKIKDTIFYQRPLKPCDELIGNCELEEGYKHCPRASYYARRFRILQDVNNLKIHNQDGTEQELNEEQRKLILEELYEKKDVKFSSIRKKLNLWETQLFNLEEGAADKKEPKLKGDEFNSQLKTILGKKRFESLSTADIIEINEIIIDNKFTDEHVKSLLMEQHNFSEEQAEKSINISLPSKYANYSELALQKLLPHMENGMLTHLAEKEVYGEFQPKKKKSEAEDYLRQPEDLRNPIVIRALVETRKVVNALIREYGKPGSIYVEMARDIKSSKEQRKKIHFQNEDNRKENEKARDELLIMGIKPSHDDIIKYKLWQECGRVCPYTGKSISQSSLFGTHPEFQIEHIIPYSRSLDDGFMNKTLCWVNENIDKGNQTPYEYYAESKPEQFEKILQRIKVLPYHKRKRFWQKEVKSDFIERQLNDTRYINKKTVEYLKMLGINVWGTRGQATSELRHQWGLNNILDYTGAGLKNRDDHRHHAIDAAVTAVTRNKHLRELAGSKYVKAGEREAEFRPPWKDFREQLEEKVNKVNVSHRVCRKASGRLHEDTNYGLGKEAREYFAKGQFESDECRQISANTWICEKELEYIYSRPLTDIIKTATDIRLIPDSAVNIKESVVRRLSDNGVSVKDEKQKVSDLFKTPLFLQSESGRKIEVKKVRFRVNKSNMLVFMNEKKVPYRACPPGSNHHIEIFETTDTKGRLKRTFRVISTVEAISRTLNNQPIINKIYSEGHCFKYSLSINEMFMLELDDNTEVLHRVQKISNNGQVFFRPHTYAGELKEQKAISKVPNQLKGYKVTVDPIGRIFPAND